MNTFTESQRFRQWWIWAILGFVVLSTTSALLTNAARKIPTAWGGIIVALLVVLLIYVWQLDTRLDSEGIHYRVFPILPWRTIPWTDVQSVSVIEYGFVGYGIRLGLKGWVYNVAGTKGLLIKRQNNSYLTIGTQRPDDVQTFLDSHKIILN
ncbi:hypothetical protein GCM10028805_56450 [Spirosoma harenae]